MASTSVVCSGCQKPLTRNTILKHLGHKKSCKEKYSTLEFKNLLKACKQSSEEKKKSWKKVHYQNNKEDYAKKRVNQSKKDKIKECKTYLIADHKNFQETYGTQLEDLVNSNPSKKNEISQIKEMVSSKFSSLTQTISEALLSFETTNASNLFDQIHNEWKMFEETVSKMISEITPGNNESKKTQITPSDELNGMAKCHKCQIIKAPNCILKHISKSKDCFEYYQHTEELKVLRLEAKKRESLRMNKKYQKQKSEMKWFEKFEAYEVKKEELIEHQKNCKKESEQWLDNWRGTNGRGERCRKEIQKLKDLKINEVDEEMRKLEKIIKRKVKELENDLDEVFEEVSCSIGHWEFDENDIWKNSFYEDRTFSFEMFCSLSHYMEEEMESLYVTVLQKLKDTASKVGQTIAQEQSDAELYKPYRIKVIHHNINPKWCSIKIPRNVILK